MIRKMVKQPVSKQLSRISEKSASLLDRVSSSNEESLMSGGENNEPKLQVIQSQENSPLLKEENNNSPTTIFRIEDERKLSLQPPPNIFFEGLLGKKRNRSIVSLPSFSSTQQRSRKDSSSSADSVIESPKFHSLSIEWKDTFHKLDAKDGTKDGKLEKRSLQSIVKTLESNSSWSLEYKEVKIGEAIQRQISEYDRNKDGYIDQEEFADFVLTTISNETDEVNVERVNVHVTMAEHLTTAARADTCKLWPPPLVMVTFSILQAVCFGQHVGSHRSDTGDIDSALIYSPERRWEAWRFLSYGFVHSDPLHLTLNLGMQLLVGLPLETSHSPGRVLAVYTAGLAAGSLATSCFDPAVYLAGASGGVYSLIAAHLASLILNWHEDRLIVHTSPGRGARAWHGTLLRLLRLTAVLAFATVDTGVAVYNKHVFSDWPNTTGYTAHLAGAGAGLLVGILVLKNRREEVWERGLKAACLLFLASLFTAGVLWNIVGDSVYQTSVSQNYFLEQSFATNQTCLYSE